MTNTEKFSGMLARHLFVLVAMTLTQASTSAAQASRLPALTSGIVAGASVMRTTMQFDGTDAGARRGGGAWIGGRVCLSCIASAPADVALSALVSVNATNIHGISSPSDRYAFGQEAFGLQAIAALRSWNYLRPYYINWVFNQTAAERFSPGQPAAPDPTTPVNYIDNTRTYSVGAEIRLTHSAALDVRWTPAHGTFSHAQLFGDTTFTPLPTYRGNTIMVGITGRVTSFWGAP